MCIDKLEVMLQHGPYDWYGVRVAFDASGLSSNMRGRKFCRDMQHSNTLEPHVLWMPGTYVMEAAAQHPGD